MIGRGILAGLSLLCALAFSDLAAPSAHAAKGTKAYTCEKVVHETGDWSDAHCTSKVEKGDWAHVPIKAAETAITVSNKNTAASTTGHTPAVIHFISGSTNVTLVCTDEHGEGTLVRNEGPPASLSGKLTNLLSECKLSGELSEKEPTCKLKEETLKTKASFSTPTEAMEVQFKEEGGPFGTFVIEGCKNKTFNAEYKITGSYTATPNGATWETEAVGSKELKVGGEPASITSTTTITMSTTDFYGIAFTTVP